MNYLAFSQGLHGLAVLDVDDKTTILVVVAGFLLMLMAVGIVFRRFSKDTSDYFRAGGRATWWILGGSMFMQGFSAWTFTGAAGAAYYAGWSLPLMFISNVVAFGTVAWFTAHRFRRLRCITYPDVVRLRFGPEMEQFVSYLSLVTSPLFGGVQLFGLAIFTSSLLGQDINTTIVILGFVVLFYSALSGAWAVLAADFIQLLVLVPISLVLAAICLMQFGGIGGFFEAISANGLTEAYAPLKSPEVLSTLPGSAAQFTLLFFAAWYFNGLLSAHALSGSGKFLSAKDDRSARMAAALTAFLMGLGLLVWFIPPMAARMLLGDAISALPLPNPSEGAYAAISMHLLPPGLVGMVLVAMCAATMSSLDASLTAQAGAITENVHPALFRLFGKRPLQGRVRLIFGKIINFCCAAYVICLALLMAHYGKGGIFQVLMDVMGTIGAPITVPMLLAMFVHRVPRIAPFAAVGVGFIVSVSIYLVPKLVDGVEPWGFARQVLTVSAVSATAFMVARYLGKMDQKAQAMEKEFYRRLRTPVDFERETGASNDHSQLRLIGAFGLVISAGILALLIPASSRGSEVPILIVFASTGAIALFLFIKGGKVPHVSAPVVATALGTPEDAGEPREPESGRKAP